MPSTYDSAFWFQRARDTDLLSQQMKDADAKAAMMKLGKKYERIALRCGYDESRIAFESAREALRVSHGTASPEQIASLTKTVDKAWEEMQAAGGVMEVFRRTHLWTANDEADDMTRDQSAVMAVSGR